MVRNMADPNSLGRYEMRKIDLKDIERKKITIHHVLRHGPKSLMFFFSTDKICSKRRRLAAG